MRTFGELWCLIVLLVVDTVRPDRPRCDKGPCGPGQYYINSSQALCHPCSQGRYMDLERHQCEECIPCSRAESLLFETEMYPCTDLSDTAIICWNGYYRKRAPTLGNSGEECEICRQCGPGEEEVQAYDTHTDTQCQLRADNGEVSSPELVRPGDMSGASLPESGRPDDISGASSPEQGRPEDISGASSQEPGRPDDISGAGSPEPERPDDIDFVPNPTDRPFLTEISDDQKEDSLVLRFLWVVLIYVLVVLIIPIYLCIIVRSHT